MVDQFEDSASASGSTELKFQRDTQSQWFDTCPDFDNVIVVAALSDTPQKPAAKKSKRAESNLSVNSNGDVLAKIRKLNLKHVKTFQKISAIETSNLETNQEPDSSLWMSTFIKRLLTI